jgi:hypothetical protein
VANRETGHRPKSAVSRLPLVKGDLPVMAARANGPIPPTG